MDNENGWMDMLKTTKGDVTVVALVVIAVVIGVGSVYFFKKHDNAIEEAAEAVIEHQLRLPEGSVDLTPSSKE